MKTIVTLTSSCHAIKKGLWTISSPFVIPWKQDVRSIKLIRVTGNHGNVRQKFNVFKFDGKCSVLIFFSLEGLKSPPSPPLGSAIWYSLVMCKIWDNPKFDFISENWFDLSWFGTLRKKKKYFFLPFYHSFLTGAQPLFSVTDDFSETQIPGKFGGWDDKVHAPPIEKLMMMLEDELMVTKITTRQWSDDGKGYNDGNENDKDGGMIMMEGRWWWWQTRWRCQCWWKLMMKVMVVTMMMMVWYKICNDDGRIRGRMMKGMMLIVIMMIIRMMILIVMVHGN